MQSTEFREGRVKAGFKSRRLVADDIGVAVDTVKDWELGRRPVPLYASKWLARALAKKEKGR